MSRSILASTVVCLALIAGASRSIACTCISATPCEEFKHSSFVFTGRVIKLNTHIAFGAEDTLHEYGVYVTFRVERTFKGQPDSEVTIVTGFGGGDCGYPFAQQHIYLVYASKGGHDQFFTSICSRTRPLEEAAVDLDYLGNLPESLSQTILWGRVTRFDGFNDTWLEFKPVAGLALAAEGRTGSHQAVTDTGGRFKFVNLPPDTYKIDVVLPNNMVILSPLPPEAKIPAGGCDETTISLIQDGRISGRILDSTGAPLTGIWVDLLPLDSSLRKNSYFRMIYSVSEYNGEYIIKKIPPGKYLLGVNLRRQPYGDTPYLSAYYPGVYSLTEAAVISLDTGQHLQNYDFRLARSLPVK
jgi:hypothetical protein